MPTYRPKGGPSAPRVPTAPSLVDFQQPSPPPQQSITDTGPRSAQPITLPLRLTQTQIHKWPWGPKRTTVHFAPRPGKSAGSQTAQAAGERAGGRAALKGARSPAPSLPRRSRPLTRSGESPATPRPQLRSPERPRREHDSGPGIWVRAAGTPTWCRAVSPSTLA